MSVQLLRIICAAVLCALVEAMAGDGPGKGIRRLLTAGFLIVTICTPKFGMEIPDLDWDTFLSDARAAVQSGQEQARAAQASIISEQCAAYIWNEAEALGLELEILVTLDDDGLPIAVTLTGRASPGERSELETIIARDLGLGKEAVTWLGPYQSSD